MSLSAPVSIRFTSGSATTAVETDLAVAERRRGAGGPECTAGLECFLTVFRAMGSWLSCQSATGHHALPFSSASDGLSSKRSSSSSSSSSASSSRKKQLKRNDSKLEMWLHRVPGRFFLSGSTDAASLFIKPGKKGVNQDAMIVWEKFGPKEDAVFCGVFDGHGLHGHMVAKKVRDSLPLKLRAHWEFCTGSSVGSGKELGVEVTSPGGGGAGDGGGRIGGGGEEETSAVGGLMIDMQVRSSAENDNVRMLKESFFKAFKVMDKELKLHPYVDCFCSGTTAVTLIKQGQDLVIANVGDSRAVLGTRDNDNSTIALQLTEDHKPNHPMEAERIRLCKGRVFSIPGEPEVARLWLPNRDSPGLAMARAFGDFCLKDNGLISVPEVSYHRITEEDEFVVLATDGVWDVLSNDEVVGIVASAPRSSAARTLVDSAIRAWRSKYPSAKIDDCAAVCLFLSSRSNNYSTSYSIHKDQIFPSSDSKILSSQ